MQDEPRLELYRIDMYNDEDEWTVTLIGQGLTRSAGITLALQDASEQLRDPLRNPDGEHLDEIPQSALEGEDLEIAWLDLRFSAGDFGLRYALQPSGLETSA